MLVRLYNNFGVNDWQTCRRTFLASRITDGNMKSWLVPTFRVTTNVDTQFFILRVSRSVFI
jgi:hypothetical protein